MRPLNSRHRDPALERALPGAALMLEACALVDASVDAAVAAAREAGRRVACGPGCDTCCRQPIPVTPLEFLVMRAQMRFRLAPDIRARLEAQHAEQCAAEPEPLRRPCPFLLDGSCSVYAVRPLACRRYLVLERPCAPGEICTESRPEDMLIPARKALHAALALTFPWYGARWRDLGLTEPPDASPESAAAQAWLASVTVPLQRLAWN
ncbi:MAG: YkgJ family cysteine cluster protein [Desulfovibrio sp.]|nr:YkgJ family cysteine cluster protein [Desulfovibrio sp.]